MQSVIHGRMHAQTNMPPELFRSWGHKKTDADAITLLVLGTGEPKLLGNFLQFLPAIIGVLQFC